MVYAITLRFSEFVHEKAFNASVFLYILYDIDFFFSFGHHFHCWLETGVHFFQDVLYHIIM